MEPRAPTLALAAGEAASHHSANRAETPHKAGSFLPHGKRMQFCKENYAFASLTFKRGLQLSLGTCQDNATKCLAQHLNEA